MYSRASRKVSCASHERQRIQVGESKYVTCEDMAYKPISNYGIVGDLHTAALIGQDGSVDWMCLPRFDSPSIFAAILDEKRGGRFTITPCLEQPRRQQLYKPDTNILVTRFMTDRAVVELTDFMPLGSSTAGQHCPRLIRRVKAIHGSASLQLLCAPKFHYATQHHQIELREHGVVFRAPDLSVHLASPIPLQRTDETVQANFSLEESQSLSFVLAVEGDERTSESQISESAVDEWEEKTSAYWQNWIGKCAYEGRWRGIVQRSALLLELLTYAPTGAVIAAPSCSLPEWVGGKRNWDYRYNWIRDAAYTVYALLRIGLFDEAERFMQWVRERCAELGEDGSLQTVYGIDGRRDLHEETIAHLEGYAGSAPVRIGNNAFKQRQLDIYGALIDAVYLYNKYAHPITAELWKDVRRLINWVCDHWQEDDHGIWELRGDPRPLVHSKVMCWVALDRGLRLAAKRSVPADLDKWLRCRDQIYEQVLSRGWNPKKRSFVQSYGSAELDASVLMMPLVFFLAPNDPMLNSTVDAICQPWSKGGLLLDGMLYRYSAASAHDGLPPQEGTFNACTLWLIEALTRMGRIQQAKWLFEKILSRANPLGLYSEETSPGGEQIGNFPQAFTHMGLISAAYNLDRALNEL